MGWTEALKAEPQLFLQLHEQGTRPSAHPTPPAHHLPALALCTSTEQGEVQQAPPPVQPRQGWGHRVPDVSVLNHIMGIADAGMHTW